MRNIIEELQRNGYIVIDDFLTKAEVDELLEASKEFCENANKEEQKVSYNPDEDSNEESVKYFLNSSNHLSYFLEPEITIGNKDIKIENSTAIQKVGHCLHVENEVFQKITFSDCVRELCWQLNFKKPVIPQGYYMFNHPGDGANELVKQDATYLTTEPSKTVGFYIALEDFNLQNGCLQLMPRSHKSGIHRRFKRNSDANSKELLIYDTPSPFYAESQFSKVPVSKGTCIIMDGQLVYKNSKNRSQTSSPLYVFHVIESEKTKYLKDNWLQPLEGKQFPILYET